MISFLDSDFITLHRFLDENQFSRLFILVDENTHEYCLPLFLGNLKTNIPFEIIEIEAGEVMKNMSTATIIWEILSEFKADRKSLLINLGGGMITDLGGFVASTYKRGISFIHVPTSLLAMCDASIGGKTGVDLGSLKNMVGTFCFPKQIFVWTSFLKTLPYNELRSGFAEMLKHGLIADEKHYQALSCLDEISPENITPFIQTSMNIKNQVVSEDFREENRRKILNFGHTFGHAIESLFLEQGNPIAHGEAVAIGMIMESHLSFLENLISEEKQQQMIETIQRFFTSHSIRYFSNDAILEKMFNDKKNQLLKINFSLLNDIGEAIYDYYPSVENIEETLLFYKKNIEK